MRTPSSDSPEYLTAWIHELLAEDPAYAELGVVVKVGAGTVVLLGTVATPERREDIGRVVREMVPDLDVHNELAVHECGEPTEPELLA